MYLTNWFRFRIMERCCCCLVPDPDLIPFFLLQVWYQNGRTPYITYEYTVLRDSLPAVPPPPVYTGSETSAGEVSAEDGGPVVHNTNINDHEVPTGTIKTGGTEGQKAQETNEVYEESAAIDCEQDRATSPKFTGESAVTEMIDRRVVVSMINPDHTC